MKYIKNITISYIYSVAALLILTAILTILNYFNIIKNGTFTFLMITNLIISVLIGGIKIAKKREKKGWLEGLKFGLIYLIILTLLNHLGFKTNINLKFIIYSLILLISGITGGMIGITIKKK